MPDVTVKRLEEFDNNYGVFFRARAGLGVTSFGMNVVELGVGETIPEHDETGRNQEEVFFTLSGDATVVIDGTEHAAPAGTFVRLDPEPRRTVVNRSSADVQVLIVSAPTSSGYEPMDWA